MCSRALIKFCGDEKPGRVVAERAERTLNVPGC